MASMSTGPNRSRRISVATWCAYWTLIASPAWSLGASLDALTFGNSSSESAHNIVLSNAPTSTTILGQSSRRLNTGGQIYFDLAIDGANQNYATVRFWGGASSGVDDRIFLGDENGNFINWAQLDDGSSALVTPDRWHYATVPLPRTMTDGQSTVRLSLYAMNNNSNYSNPPPSGAQSSPTRAIYSVFSHNDSRFVVPDSVPQNSVIAPYDYGTYQKPSAAEIDQQRNTLVNLANGIATQVANMQVTNTSGLPSALLGAFDIRTGANDSATLDATHSHHINTDNLGPLRGATILAHSYKMQGGAFQNNATTLQRIAWGIDYARRAQGATGGYVDVWSPIQWTGGPNRSDASGVLEGVTHQEIAKAFLMTHADMENAGLLDQFVDDDNNAGTPVVSRRQAYTDLFREFVDFQSGAFGGWNGSNAPRDYGHAPNQDLYQVGGLAWAMEALELLNPTAFHADPATSHDIAQQVLKTRAYQAAGVTITPHNNSWWFSPAGLPLEAGGLKGGGYSSEYGQRQSEEIWDIAQFLDDPADQAPLLEMAGKSANLWQHFWYPIYRADGSFDMRLEGALNWRNSKISGTDGKSPAHFAALDMDDPAVQRMLQLLVMNDQLHLEAPRGGHFWQDGVWMMEQVEQNIRLLDELPESDYRLPHEADQSDSAWVDPVGGAVAIRHGDSHIFMALNWHHGSSGPNPVSNDIARIHEITPFDDRVATVSMNNPFGFGALSYLTYGDLVVATNAHGLLSYDLDVNWSSNWIYDLVSQSFLLVDEGSLILEPGRAVVLLLNESVQPLPGDFNGDGAVDQDDYSVWKASYGTTNQAADGNGDGAVDALDYTVWRNNFGASLNAIGSGGLTSTPVPELSGLTTAGLALVLGGLLFPRRIDRSSESLRVGNASADRRTHFGLAS
jgi:hypothetical protein